MEEIMTVRCPACGTLNRMPAGKAVLAARCGECRADISGRSGGTHAARPVDVTDSDFDEAVVRSARPVLLEFWARSCGHCIRMEPVMDELARDYLGRLKVAKIEVSENPGTASRFNISGTPAFVLIKSGMESARLSGARPKEDLRRWLNGFI